MNDQFGFFSNFNKNKVKKPATNALSRIPVATKPNQAILTDDDDSDQEIKNSNVRNDSEAGKIQNNILNSTTADNDKTYCSVLEENKNYSESLFDTDDYKSVEKQTSKSIPADTVIGSFSDDEEKLSQRLSGMQINKSAKKPSNATRKSSLRDTIYEPFNSDESDNEEPPAKNTSRLTRENISKLVDNKSMTSMMKETVVGDFSSEEDNDEVEKTFLKPKSVPKRLPPKAQSDLRETIDNPFQYSDTEISSLKKSAQRESIDLVQEKIKNTIEKLSELGVNEIKTTQSSEEIENEKENDDPLSCSSSELEVISVLDSDEEIERNSILVDDDEGLGPPVHSKNGTFENCSSLAVTIPSHTSDTDNTLNKFFNNPPILDAGNLPVTHSIIQNHKIEMKNSPNRIKIAEPPQVEESFEINETILTEEEVEISAENEEYEIEYETDKSVSPQKESENQKSLIKSHSTEMSQETEIETGNFQLKINLNLEITVGDTSSDETDDDSDSDTDRRVGKTEIRIATPKNTPRGNESNKNTPKNQISTPKDAPKRIESAKNTPKQPTSSSKKNPSIALEKQAQNPTPTSKLTPKLDQISYQTPKRDNENKTTVIDEDLQKVLDQLYGESWKTPQLLKSCKQKKVREDLRKSIAANNFELFVKNLPTDFESTRVSSTCSSESLEAEQKIASKIKENFPTPKPSSSTKTVVKSSMKTPQISKTPASSVKSTPKYLDICDSDTASEESSESSSEEQNSDDEDFNPDQTWNASSDDDDNEEEKIRKSIIKRKSRKFDKEMIFEPPSSDSKNQKSSKNIDDILSGFEFKKPPKMLGVETPKKVSKRKLFIHSHFEDDQLVDNGNFEENNRDDEKENERINERIDVPPYPTPTKTNKKLPKSTKKTEVKAPKTLSKQPDMIISKYSFLKSLDVSTIASSFCDRDALYYRENFKAKKEELTKKLFDLYNEKVFDHKLDGLEIKWNKKLLNTAGTCKNGRKDKTRYCKLELSEKVLTSADRLRCTLIHEMCHAATWLMNGEGGHGTAWKSWAARANSIFPELPKIKTCHDYVIEYRYTYQCTYCKAQSQAHSKHKKVENIRCSICKSAIELFENKKNKNGEIVRTPVVAKEVKGFPKFVQINYKEVKRPNMTHKEVMQLLSQQFAALNVEEKMKLY